jgi:hypothetical protein
VLGVREEVAAPRALQLFLGSPYRPGGPARRVALGSPADLCVLDCPLEVALTEPSREHVRATVIAGRVIFERGQGR